MGERRPNIDRILELYINRASRGLWCCLASKRRYEHCRCDAQVQVGGEGAPRRVAEPRSLKTSDAVGYQKHGSLYLIQAIETTQATISFLPYYDLPTSTRRLYHLHNARSPTPPRAPRRREKIWSLPNGLLNPSSPMTSILPTFAMQRLNDDTLRKSTKTGS